MCQSSDMNWMWRSDLFCLDASSPTMCQWCSTPTCRTSTRCCRTAQRPSPLSVPRPASLLMQVCASPPPPSSYNETSAPGFPAHTEITVCQSWNRNVPGGAHGLLPCFSWRRGPDHASSQLAVSKTHIRCLFVWCSLNFLKHFPMYVPLGRDSRCTPWLGDLPPPAWHSTPQCQGEALADLALLITLVAGLLTTVPLQHIWTIQEQRLLNCHFKWRFVCRQPSPSSCSHFLTSFSPGMQGLQVKWSTSGKSHMNSITVSVIISKHCK